MKIIHIQSTLQTVFGVLDDKDNVVQQIPLSITLAELSDATAIVAVDKLIEERAKLKEKFEAK